MCVCFFLIVCVCFMYYYTIHLIAMKFWKVIAYTPTKVSAINKNVMLEGCRPVVVCVYLSTWGLLIGCPLLPRRSCEPERPGLLYKRNGAHIRLKERLTLGILKATTIDD